MTPLTPHASPLTADAESRPLFRVPLIILMLLGAYAIAGGLDRLGEREADHQPSVVSRHTLAHIEFDLRQCSPARTELSPIIYLAVATQPHADPEILGCTRYALTPKTALAKRRKK